ncbi:MAG: TonB-dependent receptor [Woeseiaceae bacterium]
MTPGLRRCKGPQAPLFVLLSSLAVGAAAAEIEEIVVTADFRERAAAELPSSVSVLEAETIEATAVQHFEELIGLVPNMNWSGDGHRARYLQIRGVGELEQYEGAPNPSVGFLIDDIDFSGIGTIATLFDIERIEMLRGPQGSRYGANALAGLVYVQSTDPGKKFEGTARLTAGGDDMAAGGVAFGGPLTGEGDLRYRLSAHHHRSDGFRDNPWLARDDTNGRRETTLRAKFQWDTENDWSLDFTTLYSHVDDGYDAFAIDNSLTVLSDNPGRDAQESLGASLKAIWRGADRWEFTSITSAADSDIVFSFDADWGNAQAWAPIVYDFTSRSDRKRRSVSQEFRLGSTAEGRLLGGTTDWLAGLYTLRLDDDLDTLNRGVYDDGAFSDSLDSAYRGRFDALSTALFGQLEADIGESGRLGLGLRLEHRATDYADSAGLALGPDESMVGGELSYRHTLSDALTAYVTLSRGYKAGGFNLDEVPDEDRRSYGKETLWNAEAGVKASLPGGAVTIDASIFHSRRRDQQVRTSLQLVPGDPASFVFFTDNAAEGRTSGLEVDLRWYPADAWELYAAIGLLDAEFSEFRTLQTGDAEISDLAGRQQAHAPAYTAALGGAFRHAGGLFARIDLSARDSFYFDVSHDQRSSAYALLHGRAGYAAERWTLQLWARNLLDERYAVRGFYFGNEPPSFPNELYIRQGDPRQLGVTLDVSF